MNETLAITEEGPKVEFYADPETLKHDSGYYSFMNSLQKMILFNY